MLAPEHILQIYSTSLCDPLLWRSLALFESPSTAPGSAWLLPLLALIGIAILSGIVRIASLLVKQTAALSKLELLSNLEDIQAALVKIRDDRDDLDMRRLEHVLVDIRDGNKRLEEKLTRTLEHAAAETQNKADTQRPPNLQPGLGERIVNRLLALGYGQVEIVSTTDELAELAKEGGTGDVVIEARRNGAHFKGRVLLKDGIIADVAITPAYNMFP
jgi:hypothetical protein